MQHSHVELPDTTPRSPEDQRLIDKLTGEVQHLRARVKQLESERAQSASDATAIAALAERIRRYGRRAPD